MMEKYIGTKFIEAEPQTRYVIISEGKRFVVPESITSEPTAAWLRSQGHDPTMTKVVLTPGYKVKYPDGYVSWSPQDVFDEAYQKLKEGMDFSHALTAMKAGFNVSRRSWLSRKVSLRNGYQKIELNEDTCKAFQLTQGTIGNVRPYLQVRQGDALQVYIPNMDDLLANDWHIVVEERDYIFPTPDLCADKEATDE